MEIKCPKCQHVRSSEDDANIPPTICPKCGVVYEKYISNTTLSDQEKLERIRQMAEKKRNNTFTQEQPAISTSVVILVSNFFLALAFLNIAIAVIAAGTGIFGDAKAISWGIAAFFTGQAAVIAAFGYIVKLLCGIYVNTIQE